MNWKEFIKPTNVKMIAFIILLIVSTYILVNSWYQRIGDTVTWSWQASFLPIVAPLSFILQPITLGNWWTSIIIIYALNAIYWWLLACIISFIIKKVRK